MSVNWLNGDITFLDDDVVWFDAAIRTTVYISGDGSFTVIPIVTNIYDIGTILEGPLTLIQPGTDSATNQGTADVWGVVVPRIGDDLGVSEWDQREPLAADGKREDGIAILDSPGSLWFEVAHLLPRVLQDMGHLITTQTISCDLYNADRNNLITVASISDDLGTGVTISGVPVRPFNIASQESLLFTIQVGQVGPPTINGSYTFTLSTGETYTITIVGSRVVLIPFRPEAPMQEHLTWETKIITKIDASEQRIANRGVPRGVFNFVMKDDQKFLELMFFGRQSSVVGIPAWHEPSFMSAASLEEAVTVNVTTTDYANLYVGGSAVIFTDQYIFDVVEIESMTNTSLTFTSPLVNAYPINTQVMPLMVAFMEMTVPAVKAIVNDQTFNLKLFVHATDNDIADASAFSEYNSKPFLYDPNFVSGQLQEAFETKIYVLDNLTSDRIQFAQQTRALRRSQKGFKTNTRQELWELRQLLHFLKGKQVSFYIPTFSKDLAPNQTLVNAGSTLTMDSIGYVENADDKWSKQVFRIHLNDGTILTRTILSSVKVSASVEQLTVDDVWPYDIEPEDINRIEFLEKVRFDTDDIIITHLNALGEAECFVPTKEVTDDDI